MKLFEKKYLNGVVILERQREREIVFFINYKILPFGKLPKLSYLNSNWNEIFNPK